MRPLDPRLFAAAAISLPLIYAGFALLDGDGSAALVELAIGIPWLVLGFAFAVRRMPRATAVVGALWLCHGIFDALHDSLVTNDGVPGWYPAACAVVDVAIGGYLIWLATRPSPGALA